MRKFTFSLLFAIGAYFISAQSTMSTDSVKPKPIVDYHPTYIMVGYDVVPLVNSIFYSAKTAQEVQVGIDFGNNLFITDFGIQKTTRGDSTYNYENNGFYFRSGIEVNAIKNNATGNNLTFGLKYARSYFNDGLQIVAKDYGFGEESVDRTNANVRSRWWEATIGLNVQVLKQVYFGYTVRYKIFKKNKGLEGLDPYDLPGFGRNDNKSTVGFDYYIRWIIPLKEEALPEK